jgi:hypothetical protein
VVGLEARTHKIANGDIDPTSASAHFADSGRTSPEVREVPKTDSCSAAKNRYSISVSARSKNFSGIVRSIASPDVWMKRFELRPLDRLATSDA